MSKASETLRNQQKRLDKVIDTIDGKEYFAKIPDLILDRTRGEGYGITKEDGRRQKLKGLADSTVLQRESMDRRGQLSSETTPKTSNLTATGQLLDSIVYKKSGKKHQIVMIDKRKKGKANNSDIVDGQAKMGRKFFGLTKVEREQLEKNVLNKLNESIKKIFR